MGKILLNFRNNSTECLEIMLQKYGNVLQNLDQYCRISVIMLQNIWNRSAELPKYWISTRVRREGTGTSSGPQYWRNWNLMKEGLRSCTRISTPRTIFLSWIDQCFCYVMIIKIHQNSHPRLALLQNIFVHIDRFPDRQELFPGLVGRAL